MSDEPTSSSPARPTPQRRRSSIAELFSTRSTNATSTSSSPPTGTTPTTAASVPNHRRGMSISALGLSGGGSPTQSTPFTAFARQRRASVSTSGSGSPEFRNSFGDEPAVIEEDDSTRSSANPPPSPTFARRVSFGAQALRDVKGGGPGGPAGGRRPSSSLYTLSENSENHDPKLGASSKTAATGGEGFNWSEALRDKTKRSPSFSSSANPFASRTRAPSAPAVEPPKEIPKPVVTPTKMKKPDHLGERMLRGDFMMD